MIVIICIFRNESTQSRLFVRVIPSNVWDIFILSLCSMTLLLVCLICCEVVFEMIVTVNNKNSTFSISVFLGDLAVLFPKNPFLLYCIYISLGSLFTLTSRQINLPPIYLHPPLLHFITRHNFFSASVSLLSSLSDRRQEIWLYDG